MSSILKALRKIEEEKRVAEHVAPDLRVDQGLTRVKSGQYLPLLAGVVLGAAVVGLFFFLGTANDTASVVQGGSEAEPVKTAVAVSSPKEMPLVADIKSADLVVTPDLASVQNHSVSTEPGRTAEVSLSPKPVSAVAQHKALSPKEPAVALPQVIVPAKAVAAAKQPDGLQEIFTVLPDGVSLLVTEIFYQADGSDSMALVNDLPVMVGTHIESAVVDEIRPEQVLFRVEDKLYLVSVSGL